MDRKIFKFPACGGQMFGSSNCLDDENMMGHCHGFLPDGSRCNFTWHRKTQDVDVFVNHSTINAMVSAQLSGAKITINDAKVIDANMETLQDFL